MRVLPRSSLFFASVLLGTALLVPAPLWAQDAAPAPIAPQPERNTTSWSTFKGDAQRSGSSAANIKLPLSLTWRFSSDAVARTFISSPLVVGAPGRQRVIFGVGRNVYCLDAQTGAQTGTQVWKSDALSSSIVTPITLLSGDNGDLVIVAEQSGKVSALRVSDGQLVWGADALASITDAGPLIIDTPRGRRIVVAVTAGRLVAITLDGKIDPEWKVPLGRFGITPTSSMTLSPDGKLIFIIASDAKLYAIDTQKGALAYALQLPANSAVTPVIADDRIVTANVQRVSAFGAASGSAAWDFAPKGEIIGSPSVGKDATGKTVIYFGTRDGQFYALDGNGALVWKTDVKTGITSPPLVLPSLIVVGTSSGMLLGLDPVTGVVNWQYRLKTERYTAPNNNNGGGFGGGGRGGRGGGANTQAQPTTRLWGVSAAPAAIDNQLFVLADNAALYSFTTQTYDAAAPRIVEPSIGVPDEANIVTPLLLSTDADRPTKVAGRGPMFFAVQLEDTGSGVNPDTIKVTVDDAPVAADAIDWDMEAGVLTVTLLDPSKGTALFTNGLKTINLTAKDYAGNQLNVPITFVIDSATPAPQAGGQNGRGGFGRGGGGGFGGRGGGGGFGGPGGGFGGPGGGFGGPGGDNRPGGDGPGGDGPGGGPDDNGPGGGPGRGPGEDGPGDNGPGGGARPGGEPDKG